MQGLTDRSPRPQRQANRLPAPLEARIVRLKREYPGWGAPKIREKLRQQCPELRHCPAISTVHAVLDRYGLAHHRRRRRPTATGTVLSRPLAPNALWCADYKGEFMLANRRYCYPLRITDFASRYLLTCDALSSTKETFAFVVSERAFKDFGFPAAIRTDNGVPFASPYALYRLSKLSVWWLSLGIQIERIAPGHPEQNGRHERMHLTLKKEAAAANVLQQQARFDAFVDRYNRERPHQALDMKVPADVYTRSALLGFQRLVDIRRRDVRELVENIARKRDAPIMANRTLGVLCRMFNFALDREWMEANPASRIPEPGVEKSRDRVLSDEELRELWPALECLASDVEDETDEAAQILRRAKARVTPATAQAFQVQPLTAQRPGETQKMRWADVDLESGWWTIPASVAKNELAHRVPLTKPVIEILRRRRELGGETAKVVFENRRGAGSIAHRGKKAASILCRGLSFTFRAHDLRRTASTGMAEAGVPRDHIAKVLNHVEGGPAATRIYDRYAYDKEKRDALERWAVRLQAIVQGKIRKVVPIAR